jgi:hypothetical protein
MPAVVNMVRCPACDKQHTLCCPEEDVLFPATEYDFECPNTHQRVSYRDGELSELLNRSDLVVPRGALILRRVGRR